MPELDSTALGGIGHFDKQGNACLKFHLCGVKQGVWLLPEELLDKLSKEADKAKGKKQLQAEAKGRKQMKAEAKGKTPLRAKDTASDSKAPQGKKRSS